MKKIIETGDSPSVIYEYEERLTLGQALQEAVQQGVVNFDYADLRGVELVGATLKGINLSNANLSKARLSGCQFVGVSLFDADLSYTIFENGLH